MIESSKKNYESLSNPSVPCECADSICSKISYQYAKIGVPVEIKPNVSVGKITSDCCDEPIVCCKSRCDNSCSIIISQNICIKIPIKYDIGADIGESFVTCENKNCDKLP
ncbi:MAG: hypothetical protein RR246_02690 [Clostridia bacterium]